MQIYKYSVGTPVYTYPTNSYLISLPNGEAILIDTGVDTDANWDALCNTMWEAGISWQNIKYIILTHGHADHFGMSVRVLEHAPAVVLIHSADRLKVMSEQVLWSGWQREIVDLLLDHGMPSEEADGLLRVENLWHNMFREIPGHSIRAIEAPSRLDFAGLSLEVIPAPGHSLGSCCFFSKTDNILFSGDALLPNSTPNPLVEFGFGKLQVYQGTIQMRNTMLRLRRLAPEKVLPGHGEPIFSIKDLIDSQLESITARSERVLAMLDIRSLNTFEIAQQLFNGVPISKQLFAFSETIGYLGWLESRGLIRRQQISGSVRWVRKDN